MIEVDMTKMVPKFILNDINGYAMTKAIESGMQSMNDIIDRGVKCITDPETMPEWRLDEIAWETNCLYDYAADIEVKRAWIKNALPLYRIYGTPGAIEEVIKAMLGSGKVVEWFDFEGEKTPYQFDIETDARTDIETMDKMLTMVEKSKNTRSVLRNLKFKILCDFNINEVYLIKETRRYHTTEVPKL
ncbi:MAG: phage tail protein I [Eubacteriales bacterium]|nr:phage tail protein I [Eubacteriales bacterium]